MIYLDKGLLLFDRRKHFFFFHIDIGALLYGDFEI